MEQTTRIGVVGLGHMGGNMAARFLDAGYTVYGDERIRERAQDLVHDGLHWCDTPREAAEAADHDLALPVGAQMGARDGEDDDALHRKTFR